jgi:hypothetical protein
VPNRLVPGRERHVWMVIYVLVAVSVSAALCIWVRLGQPPTHSIVARASAMAIASLRGLAAALVTVSLALDVRLRELHRRSRALIRTRAPNLGRR